MIYSELKNELENLQKSKCALSEQLEKHKMNSILRNEAVKTIEIALKEKENENNILKKENEELQKKIDEFLGRPRSFEVHKGTVFKSLVKVSSYIFSYLL